VNSHPNDFPANDTVDLDAYPGLYVNSSAEFEAMFMPNKRTYQNGVINHVKGYTKIANLSGTSSAPDFWFALYTHATEYESGGHSPPYTGIDDNHYGEKTTTWTDNPNTSTTWTWDEIDDLLIGCHMDGDGYQNMKSWQIYYEVESTEEKTSETRVTQLYAIINYTPPTETVTLNTPKNISCSHSRKITRFHFPDGEYEVKDFGRSGKRLSISGFEYSSADDEMQDLKDMCHYGAVVTIAGLDDTNLNKDYYIRDFNCERKEGEPEIYHWQLVLEEA